MLRTTIRGLIAHKRRLVTTALAVMLGVAFMAGTLVLTDTIGKTFDDLFADVYKDTDAVVRAEEAFEGPMNTGAQRGRIDASLVPFVRAVDGVAAAQGDVFGFARILGRDGEALGNPEMGAPTFGGAWTDLEELNPYTLAEGNPPRAADEVAIDRKSAKDGNLAVGDRTVVLVVSGPQTVRISGIVTFGTADSPGGASVALFAPSVAGNLLAQPGRYDSISVVAERGVSQEALVERIRAVLPEGVEVLTGGEITDESQDTIQDAFSFFNTFMLVFAVVALLVGGFMIFNTFSITVMQRTRENGLLRALGATRRQVLSTVLLEAAVVGLLASVAGLALGVVVAGGLKAMLSGLGFDIASGGVVFSTRTVVVSLLAGLVVTTVAAISPARKAAKVSPVEAMHAGAVGSTGYGSKERVIVGLGILGLGVAGLLWGLFGDVDDPLPPVGLGVLLVFFGVSVLGRTVSLPLSRALGAPLPRVRGTAGILARENAMRNPKRTAASASALMIGVGLVGFITILASSTTASINASIDKAFVGDLVVHSGGGFFGGVDPGLAVRLNELPEVASATGIRSGFAQVEGKAVQITGVDPATAFTLVDVEPLEGRPGDLGPDAIALHSDAAKERGLALGDPVNVLFKDTGEQVFRVALIYGETEPLESYILGHAAYDANFADRFDAQVYVKAAQGTPLASARQAVEEVALGYPGAKVFDQEEFKADQARFVDQILALVYALLALAIVIALLGIGNTLALAIYERTRELGLLRAVGMTRAQLRSTIRWESVIIALQGTALGLVIGLFFGWALVEALADQGMNTFHVPVGNLTVVVVLAALAGVVAAIGPSRRAAKLNVLRAIAGE